METLTANVGAAREVMLRGRRHLVAPITLIVPGVLNGSQGPLLYPLDEIAKNVHAWNGMPLVVRHPDKGTSARDPEVFNAQGVGRLYKAKANGKLTAEAWFEVERLVQVDSRLLNALLKGESIEVSTGLITHNEPAPPGSVHTDGRPYSHVARNYQPDHVAVLLDQVGACSVDDGCGLLVNEDKSSLWQKLGALLGVINQSSARLIGTTGVTRKHSHSVDLSELGNGYTNHEQDHEHRVKLFKVQIQWQDPEGTDRHTHSLDRKSLIDSGVLRNSENETSTTKESDMDPKEKKALIDGLIANCDCWEEADREFLEGRSDRSLEVFQLAVNASAKIAEADALTEAAQKGFTDPGGQSHTYNTETKVWVTKAKVEPPPLPTTENAEGEPAKPPTTEEWMKSAPEDVRRAVTNALEIEKAEREKLTVVILENAEDDAKDRLQKHAEGLSMDALRDFATLYRAAKPPEQTQNWRGAASPAGTQNTGFDKNDILPVPTMNDLVPAKD